MAWEMLFLLCVQKPDRNKIVRSNRPQLLPLHLSLLCCCYIRYYMLYMYTNALFFFTALFLKSRKSTVLDAMRRNMRPDALNVVRYTNYFPTHSLLRTYTWYSIHQTILFIPLFHTCTAQKRDTAAHIHTHTTKITALTN